MFKRRAPADPGLEQIDNWEQWRLTGTLQKMKDDGLDADTIAREYPAKEVMITAAAEQLRVEYRANRARGAPRP